MDRWVGGGWAVGGREWRVAWFEDPSNLAGPLTTVYQRIGFSVESGSRTLRIESVPGYCKFKDSCVRWKGCQLAGGSSKEPNAPATVIQHITHTHRCTVPPAARPRAPAPTPAPTGR
jgi:hypothetical protein